MLLRCVCLCHIGTPYWYISERNRPTLPSSIRNTYHARNIITMRYTALKRCLTPFLRFGRYICHTIRKAAKFGCGYVVRGLMKNRPGGRLVGYSVMLRSSPEALRFRDPCQACGAWRRTRSFDAMRFPSDGRTLLCYIPLRLLRTVSARRAWSVR